MENDKITKKNHKFFTFRPQKHTCNICQRNFSRKKALENHIKVAHESIDTNYEENGDFMEDYIDLDTKEIIKNEDLSDNDFQNDDYVDYEDEDDNEEDDSDEDFGSKKRHKCKKCTKSYKSKRDLDRHFAHIHDENAEKHQCDKCLKTYVSLSVLKHHIKTAHEGKYIFRLLALKIFLPD